MNSLKKMGLIIPFLIFTLIFVATPVFATSIQKLDIIGFNTVLGVNSISPAGCLSPPFSSPTCTFNETAQLEGTPIGKATVSLTTTILFSQSRPNAHGFICMPFGVSAIVTTNDGSTLSFEEERVGCIVAVTGAGPIVVSSGGFAITGGTGRFKGATGGGSVASGTELARDIGAIQLP